MLLVLFAVTCFSLQAAAAPRVQVRGTSRLEVRAAGPRDRVQVSGTLRDETGTPIPDALLVVTPMADATVPVAWRGVGACSDEELGGGGQSDQTVTADSVGGFCLVGALSRDEASIRIVYGGGSLHEGTRTEVLWNALQRPLSLRFAPRPERIDLDAPRVLVFARVAGPEGVAKHGLELQLTGEGNEVLARATTDASGAAHFDFPSSKLPGPGIGVLQVTFPGREDLAAASASATVTRTARVHLAAQEQEARGDPTRGIPVRIRADTSRGPAQAGTVEATLDHAVVGAAPVVDGLAEVVLSFRPKRDQPSHGVSFRYRPDTPYYEPAGTIGVAVIAQQPSPWLRGLPVLLALAVAGWLLRGWWRPKRRDRVVTPKPTFKGEPSLEIVGAPRSRGGWSGRVIDAHDGDPIEGARVRVIVPTFLELDVVVDELTDEDGRFSFDVRSSEKELRLVVESDFHAEMERKLPPASDMVVALVSRRRVLLDRLVKWARRAGKPWHREPEPTPGHVVLVAQARRRRGDVVAAWAQGVERCAYGPDPVDRRSEQEVRDL
ncbi:MAG: hypothetical protein ACOC1F_09870, partial [Myxococcota bacterium]